MDNFFTRAFRGFGNYEGPLFPEKWGSEIFLSVGSFFSYDMGGTTLSKFLLAYSKNPIVYMIIQRIAKTTASLERKFTDLSGEDIENSQLEQILNKPNKDQGREEFFEEIYEYFLTTGNVFILFTEGIGMGFELTILNSSRMKLKLDNLGQPLRWVYSNNLGKDLTYELDEILHIKTSNICQVNDSAVYFGLSPLEAAWMLIKSSGEIFSAEASIFKNRGIIGILTNETDTPMLEPERRVLQEQFDQEVGGADRYNKIKISNTKLKYIQTGMSPTDLKLLEGILNKLRMISAIFQMPSVLFNDNERSTYNNMVEAERNAHNNSYLPLARKVDRELSYFLSEKLGFEEMMSVDRAQIEVLRASTNTVAQELNSLPTNVAQRVSSAMTRNEARNMIGLSDLEDEEQGSELLGDGKADQSDNQNNQDG